MRIRCRLWLPKLCRQAVHTYITFCEYLYRHIQNTITNWLGYEETHPELQKCQTCKDNSGTPTVFVMQNAHWQLFPLVAKQHIEYNAPRI